MKKETIYGIMEKTTCPKCKGFGGTFTDALKDVPCLCNGHGTVWYDKIDGFLLPLNKNGNEEKNYSRY